MNGVTYTTTAQLRCECGATCQVAADVGVDRSSSGWSGCDCRVEYDCDYFAVGWFSDSDRIMCPRCKDAFLDAKYPPKPR